MNRQQTGTCTILWQITEALLIDAKCTNKKRKILKKIGELCFDSRSDPGQPRQKPAPLTRDTKWQRAIFSLKFI